MRGGARGREALAWDVADSEETPVSEPELEFIGGSVLNGWDVTVMAVAERMVGSESEDSE